MSASSSRQVVQPWYLDSARLDAFVRMDHVARAYMKQGAILLRLVVFINLVLWFLGAGSSADVWPSFRGNPQLTGVADSALPKDLKLLWKVDVKEPVTSTAAIVDGTVYVGADDSHLYALKTKTGETRWRYAAKEAIRSSPTVAEGVVYFGDQGGTFHAVDARTGTPKWTFQTEAEIVSSALFHDQRVIFGSYDAHVYCLSVSDGSLNWKYETGGRVHASPALVDNAVLVAGCDEYIHLLKLKNGEQTLRIPMSSVVGASPAILGQKAFVGTYNQDVLAFEWAIGKILWRFRDEERQFPILASAAANESVVVVAGRDKRIRAFDASSGEVRWTFVTKARVDSSPVIAGNRVYAGSHDGNLYGIGLSSGLEEWKYESGAPISASPAIAEGVLIVGNEDGLIHCFGNR